MDRPPSGRTDYLDDGFDIEDVAIAPDGRVAVLDTRSVLEVFAP